MTPISKHITPAQLGDFLQNAFERGLIGEEAHESIEAGVLPVRLIREKLKCLIERGENGFFDLTFEEGFSQEAANDNSEDWRNGRLAA